MPPWAFNHMDILAHEMGHGFGLPHSSGPYSSTYDSQWDIMSRGGTCASTNYGFGCIGVHTVSWHKDVLGWIDASDVYVDDGTQNQVVFIERLAEPINVSDPNVYQVVKIPTSSSTDFYTLEVRKFAGFDNIGKIPGEAVVIHKVDTMLSDRNAQVVVNPYESSGTNGPGSKWTTGEEYQFPNTNTSVIIGAMENDGFTITLNPNGANTPPTADAGGETIVIDEDDDGYEEVTLDGSGSSDPDEGGTIVSYDWDLNEDGAYGDVTGINPTHNFAVGDHTVSLRVTDNEGATGFDTTTVSILAYVPPENNAPIADDASPSTDEDTPLPITLSATDADDDSLTYSVVSNPTNGVLSGSAPDLTYTPDSNYNGPDSFTFTANDGYVDSNTATVTLSIAPVNDAPTALDDSYNTDEDTPVAVTLSASDVDGDPLIYSYTNPTFGTLSGTAPNLTYTPNSDSEGNHSFTFYATDNPGGQNSNIATITINVNPINDLEVSGFGVEISGGNRWAAQVTINVVGQDGAVSGASVAGTWSNGANGSGNCTTDGNGQCTVQKRTKNSEMTYTVNTITKSSTSYEGGDCVTIDRNGPIACGDTPPGNQSPNADAGGDQTVYDDVSQDGIVAVTLDGTGSSDADGTIVSYEWDTNNDGFFDDDTGSSPTVSFSVEDSPHTVSLRVTDDDGATDIDSITITVNPYTPTTAVHVASIDDISQDRGGPWWYSNVKVTVNDDGTAPVQNVTVTGYWDDDVTDTASCITASDGSCEISERTRSGPRTFTVDSLSGSAIIDDPAHIDDPNRTINDVYYQ